MTAAKHFLSLRDLGGRDELLEVLALAKALKQGRGAPAHRAVLEGKSVALVFEKASTRTRLSFEVGVHELGAHPLVVLAKDSQLGRGEPLEDTAVMFSRFVHGVMMRVHQHETLKRIAAASRVPVINGLCDLYHPCQLLADLQTMQERFGTELKGRAVAWVGDGNNVAHSWINAAAMLGFSLRLACPPGYEPHQEIVNAARAEGADVMTTHNPREAVRGVDAVVTDVWASMGQEAEQAARISAFQGFCVDESMMAEAATHAIFMHCLPAHRGEEVTGAVIDGPRSAVWDEAENRLHAQKALLVHLLAPTALS